FAEFEKDVPGIMVGFGVQDQALLDLLTGAAEPSGLLPLQMPANMETVEKQAEDVPHDMDCHVDAEGHVYDFGYGLNWKGVINDARTAKYKKATKQKQSKP
ncbi:MAG TPA: glycoside hydrolase family 3 C-terminal domain-containing protein, partial [Chitinophagaceae bacterium]|nr:glycoside hydrolase family 3 C-terminal domain-containing protein [Chitinophagaceae bacterium]